MFSKFKLLAKDTLLFALGSIGSKAILFLLVPLYTNYLTTGEYGNADLVFTYAQLMIPVLTVMIYDAVLRFGSSKDVNLPNVALCGLITCTISGVISFLLLPFLRKSANVGEWAIYLSTHICLACFYQLLINYLKVKNRNDKYAIVSILNTFFLAGSNVLLIAVFRFGIRGYLLSNIIGTFVACGFALVWSGIIPDSRHGKFDFDLWKKMLAYSWPLIFTNIAWWVIHSSDKLMIKGMINESQLGIYTTAAKIPSLINVIIGIFSQAWGLSSIREVEGDNDNSYFSSVLKYYSLFVFGSAILIIMVIRPFMNIYVGPDFKSAWRYTPLLISAAVFYAIATYYASIYSAIKKTKNAMWTTGLCAILNIVINYFGIKAIGAFGAVFGTVVSFAFLAVVRMWDVGRIMQFDMNINRTVINGTIMLALAILITLDYYTLPAVIAAGTLFILINLHDISFALHRIRKLVLR